MCNIQIIVMSQKNQNYLKNGAKYEDKDEDQQKQKQITQLASRFELHLRQLQAIENLKINSGLSVKMLSKIENSLSSFWNRFLPVTIRGPVTEKEFICNLFQPHKLGLNESEQQNLLKFLSIVSCRPQIQDDLVQKKRVICIFYTKQSIPEMIEQLHSQFIQQLVQGSSCSQWCVSVKNVSESDKNSIWMQKIKQMAAEQQIQQSLSQSELSQITNKVLNAKSTQRPLRAKQSAHLILNIRKSSTLQNSKVSNKIHFPLVVPLWRGMFDQIIMFRPIPINEARLDLINAMFWEREQLQTKVESQVEISMKLKLEKNEADMDSIHKIQISQYKQQI